MSQSALLLLSFRCVALLYTLNEYRHGEDNSKALYVELSVAICLINKRLPSRVIAGLGTWL